MDEPRHPPSAMEFRWQALFQRTAAPVFLLNRQRRILFVNRAWEELTQLSATEARGLRCVRRPALPQDPWDVVIRAVCCPPPEVLHGAPGRTRRRIPQPQGTPQWWDVDFLPLHDPTGLLCVLGKITPLAAEPLPASAALPEKLTALRQRLGQRYGFDQLTSTLPSFQRVVEQVRLASQTMVPVLLVGEPGTGKQWVARTIHHQGLLREGTFASLDGARLPAPLLAALLFGDSSPARPLGRGTRYLKEPSLLSRELQVQLTAFLHEAADGVAARLIVGCSTDPQLEVQAGRLVEAFYFALSTLVIHLPPLRERLADLPILVERLLAQLNAERERPITELTPEAWEMLRAYAWPGNLRELYDVLQGACARTPTGRIAADHLPARLRLEVRLEQMAPPVMERPLHLDKILEQAERRLIITALRKARGNRSRAAELLSIWRPRLLRRMEALGIHDW